MCIGRILLKYVCRLHAQGLCTLVAFHHCGSILGQTTDTANCSMYVYMGGGGGITHILPATFCWELE